MANSRTLGFYVASRFLLGILVTQIVLAVLIFLIDFVELLRQSGSLGEVPITTIIMIAILRLPAYAEFLISFAVLAFFVNLLAAFLAMLAIAFYVIVYTMLMKRTTPQNIVIGGAAGALPPVIGWVAATGSVGFEPLVLFLIIFLWTPPHFWALSLRIAKDYAAAGVPMLPVVRGVPETTRQIALYTVLLVAISLVLFAVARMGLIYLATALILGAIFLWQAYRLWRVGTSPDASTAGAIRLYRYSITYLSLLFLAIAVDAIIVVPV